MTLFDEPCEWAFLFPGIGVKPFGKEGEFYRKYRALIEPYLHKGSEIVGIDLAASLLQNTTFGGEQLSREVFAYVFSYGAFQVFREHGLVPKLVAGHSLGIYAALTASEAIRFEDGLAIVEKAHQLGRKYNPEHHFGVVVIIGLDHDEVAGVITEKGYQSVNLANLNNSSSGVYVGYKEETDSLLAWAEGAGAIKTITLRIDIPFHSPFFMQEASRELRTFLESFHWQRPVCPILSALDHSLLTTEEQLIEMTAANLSHPIHWPGVMNKLAEIGVERVIECGAGVSLSQHARFIESAPRHYNLRNLKRRLFY
ncbi:MAG: acyltransferase domain-containing protein [Syntrophobacterales bacterium]|nr:MAG: acyltransferase domain-containing protein [Syntrophobacterales bacterium]